MFSRIPSFFSVIPRPKPYAVSHSFSSHRTGQSHAARFGALRYSAPFVFRTRYETQPVFHMLEAALALESLPKLRLASFHSHSFHHSVREYNNRMYIETFPKVVLVFRDMLVCYNRTLLVG